MAKSGLGGRRPPQHEPQPRLTQRTFDSVEAAAAEAYVKHGLLPSDPVRACAILGREWGEAMNEALLATSPRESSNVRRHEAEQRLCVELAQVAATAMLIIQAVRGK
jgi:hypothetical protein